MTVTARSWFVLAAVVLSAAYYYSAMYVLGWMSGHERPGWWMRAFPSRLSGALAWVIVLHSAFVLCAALPVAVAAVAIAKKRATQLGLLAAVLATIASMFPLIGSTAWSLVWNSEPILFVTDQIKLIVAVPFIAWIIQRTSSNNRFERSRGRVFGSQGGSR